MSLCDSCFLAELQEAALYVIKNKSIEEALRIFTEVITSYFLRVHVKHDIYIYVSIAKD